MKSFTVRGTINKDNNERRGLELLLFFFFILFMLQSKLWIHYNLLLTISVKHTRMSFLLWYIIMLGPNLFNAQAHHSSHKIY